MDNHDQLDFQVQPVEDLSLYIHIPFCSHRCHYCHFYFEITRSEQVHQRTLDHILREARWYRQIYEDVGAKPRIDTLYLGGGTPSLLSPALLDSFLQGLEDIWGYRTQRPREMTLEANPESLGPELLEVLAERGFDRISLGVQSFQGELLRTLGRQAGPQELDRALDNLKEARRLRNSPRTLSLDLIIGIPGQSPEMLRRDLEALLERSPDHVSLYQLSIDPGTPLYQSLEKGRIKALSSERQEELWTLADHFLLEQGWENYEISNYAKESEHRSLHNLRYWQWKPYLGLGPGASGTFPARPLGHHIAQRGPHTGQGTFRPLRIVNPELLDYGRHWDSPGVSFPPLGKGKGAEREWLGPREWFIELLITGLRTPQGSSWELLDQSCSGQARKLLGPWLEKLTRQGHYSPGTENGRLALTREGRFLLDPLLVELLDQLPPEGDPLWRSI